MRSRRSASASLTRPTNATFGAAWRLQAPRVRPVPGDDERQAELAERADRDLDALVGHDLREHEVVLADVPGREAAGLDRRVENRRVAGEVALDAPLRDRRVRDVGVHALGGDEVPLAPAAHDRREQRPRQRAARGQGRLALVPRVAERVVAVADVDRLGIRDHAVRPRRRARDDEVVAAQVQRLHRRRVERQQRAERARRRAQALQARRVHPAMGEASLGAPLVVDRGEQIRVRVELAELQEDPLGSAEVEQEVVNERDAPGSAEGVRRHAPPSVPGRRRRPRLIRCAVDARRHPRTTHCGGRAAPGVRAWGRPLPRGDAARARAGVSLRHVARGRSGPQSRHGAARSPGRPHPRAGAARVRRGRRHRSPAARRRSPAARMSSGSPRPRRSPSAPGPRSC